MLSDKPAAAVRVDLNADLGEWPAGSSAETDRLLMAHITSANIACGGHAGDEATMRETVAQARRHQVAVGAHPSFPDRPRFGRHDMHLPLRDVEAIVFQQVGELARVAAAEGVRMQHVKPHGALYNMAARDRELADAIASATAAVDPTLILFGPPGSALLEAGRRAGLRTAGEACADRAYRADGSLVPRGDAGAVISSPDIVVARAVAMAREHSIISIDGHRVPLEIDTICVHGDTPGAAALVRQLHDALVAAGIDVKAAGAP